MPALRRGLAVLRLLAAHHGPMPASSIATALGLPRSTVYHPRLASDVRWVAHGGPTTVGRDGVIEVCERTRADLATTETTFPSGG